MTPDTRPAPAAPSLPVELWDAILARVSSRGDLFSASLVCRIWNYAALERLWERGPHPHVARSVAGFLKTLNGGGPLREIGVQGLGGWRGDDFFEPAWNAPPADTPERRHLVSSGFLVDEVLGSDKDAPNGRVARQPLAEKSLPFVWKEPAEYGALVRHFAYLGDYMDPGFAAISGKLVSFLFKTCPNLRSVNIAEGLDSPPPRGTPRAAHLEKLRLPWMPFEAIGPLLNLEKIVDLHVHINPESLNSALASMPHLRSVTFIRHGRGSAANEPQGNDHQALDVSGLHIEENYLPDLPPTLISARLEGAVSSSVSGPDEFGARLIPRLAQIKSLEIHHTRMKDLPVLPLLSSLESLELRDLPNLPQILVATSSGWGPRIKRLYLESRSSMFEVAFLLRQLDPKNLRELTLRCSSPWRANDPQSSSTPSPQNPAPTTQTAMGFLPTLFPNLTLLRLEGFPIPDLDTMLANLAGPRGPRRTLRTLALANQPGMSPDPLLDCLARLKLEVISLQACNLDDRVVAEILAKKSPRYRARTSSASSVSGSELLSIHSRRSNRLPDSTTARQLRRAIFSRNAGITLTELPTLLSDREVPALDILDLASTRANPGRVEELKESVNSLAKTWIRCGRLAQEVEDWLFDESFD